METSNPSIHLRSHSILRRSSHTEAASSVRFSNAAAKSSSFFLSSSTETTNLFDPPTQQLGCLLHLILAWSSTTSRSPAPRRAAWLPRFPAPGRAAGPLRSAVAEVDATTSSTCEVAATAAPPPVSWRRLWKLRGHRGGARGNGRERERGGREGWEVTVIKQEETAEGPLEMQIALPSMPSLYIISFLYQACLEIHRVGGHILDRVILHNFAWELLQKVIVIYEKFVVSVESGNSLVSEKGVLQVLLDLRFLGDVLSGGKNSSSKANETLTKQDSLPSTVTKTSFRRKQSQTQADSAAIEPVNKLINKLSQRLDPIDWATYEPYLWENEKQSYKRYVVLFGFLVQLNHMYTGTVQKLPTKSNTDSNIMRCSQVPRFKYLPISAPAISSRAHKSSLQSPSGDSTSKSTWKSYSNGERSTAPEFDDNASLVGAAPLLKSFVTQVGSKFGENTSRWGSMLSDGQVGKLSDILPGPAAGFFSSFTSGVRYDS